MDTGRENAEGQTYTNAGSFPGLPASGGCHHYATRLPQRGCSESLPAARIPDYLFASIQEAPLEAFQRDAPLIECRREGKTVAVVAVDRSDAKITVRSILLSACIVHAEWDPGMTKEAKTPSVSSASEKDGG